MIQSGARSLLAILTLVTWLGLAAPAIDAAVRFDIPGFTPTFLPANDDGSSGVVPIGFTIDLFGVSFSNLFVNNNGNVTFNSPLGSFTPSQLNQLSSPIIAPFWADVDTRGAGIVAYGTGTLDPGLPTEKKVFAVTWFDVGYFGFNTDKRNTFQLVLIDQSAAFGVGSFDIEFNYDQVQWETGDASGGNLGLGGSSVRVGYANGTQRANTSFELPGSARPGAFLAGGPNSLVAGSQGSGGVPGRYVFPARNGLLVADTRMVIGLVGLGVLGTLPDGPSGSPVINGLGSAVAYQSSAPNLSLQLCGGSIVDPVRSQIYRRDLFALQTLCISQGSSPGNGESTNPTISHDGNRIAFQSNATNFPGGVCNDGRTHIFLGTVSGQTVTLTCLTAGANESSSNPAISADGSVVAYETLATNQGCAGGQSSVVAHNVATEQKSCVTPGGNGPSGSPAISGNGSRVVFRSRATNLVAGAVPPAGCTSGLDNVLVRTLPSGPTTCVSRTPTGQAANGASGQPDISDDGAVIAYASVATNISSACTNGLQQIYIARSGGTGISQCFSLALNGAPGNGTSSEPALSGDGLAIAFTTDATNIIPPSALPPGPFPNPARAVVAQAGALTQVMQSSTNVAGAVAQLMSSGGSGAGNGSSRTASLNFTGNRTVFATAATNLFSGDTNGADDIVTSNSPSQVAGRVSILAPANGSVFPLSAPTPITFAWTDASASAYGFEFSCPNTQFTNPNASGPDPANGFGSSCGGGGFLVGDPGFSTTLLPGSLPPGNYNVRVIPFNVAGATFSDAVGLTIGLGSAGSSPTPTITAPASGTPVARGAQIGFAWTGVAGAPQYLFSFAGPITGNFPLATTSFVAAVPDIPPGAYQITITALNAAGQPLGPASAPVTVNVQ
jgi:Tol biopolymer transport system component